jgi:hypothetical protein
VTTMRFDRSYWPKEGELVPTKPEFYDLESLWDECEPQASIFVAEALIADQPTFHVEWEGGKPRIECFLWTVGEDCLTVECDLTDEIMVKDYDHVRSDGQADDVRERLLALNVLQAAIETTRAAYTEMLAEYESVPGKETP